MNLSRGELPAWPNTCTGEQWALVIKMCRHEPVTRVKISTVVDELARLAMNLETADGRLKGSLSSSGDEIVERGPVPAGPSLLEIISTAKKQLADGTEGALEHDHGAMHQIYRALWGRLEEVYALVANKKDFSRHDDLRSLVEAAHNRTKKLQRVDETLGELTEATLHGYALHRRLNKFISAHFLNAADWPSVFDRKRQDARAATSFDSSELLRPLGAARRRSVHTQTANLWAACAPTMSPIVRHLE